MEVTKFKFEIIHGLPINVEVWHSYFRGSIRLPAMCPVSKRESQDSRLDLQVYEQIGAMLATQ
jgi:hypothetical protein